MRRVKQKLRWRNLGGAVALATIPVVSGTLVACGNETKAPAPFEHNYQEDLAAFGALNLTTTAAVVKNTDLETAVQQEADYRATNNKANQQMVRFSKMIVLGGAAWTRFLTNTTLGETETMVVISADKTMQPIEIGIREYLQSFLQLQLVGLFNPNQYQSVRQLIALANGFTQLDKEVFNSDIKLSLERTIAQVEARTSATVDARYRAMLMDMTTPDANGQITATNITKMFGYVMSTFLFSEAWSFTEQSEHSQLLDHAAPIADPVIYTPFYKKADLTKNADLNARFLNEVLYARWSGTPADANAFSATLKVSAAFATLGQLLGHEQLTQFLVNKLEAINFVRQYITDEPNSNQLPGANDYVKEIKFEGLSAAFFGDTYLATHLVDRLNALSKLIDPTWNATLFSWNTLATQLRGNFSAVLQIWVNQVLHGQGGTDTNPHTAITVAAWKAKISELIDASGQFSFLNPNASDMTIIKESLVGRAQQAFDDANIATNFPGLGFLLFDSLAIPAPTVATS